jgi:hypothetical protein
MYLPWYSCAIILSLGAVIAAADAQPPPVQAALEHLRSANAARTAVAGESAAWLVERQRLEALISATEAESARLIRDAEVAERDRDAATERLAALGRGSDLDALRLRLGEAGQAMVKALSELARRLPPGAVPTPVASSGEDGFDAAVRSLDATERAAGSVVVEVVTGERDGMPAAVKMLRVAGAAAWWVSLDGAAAGTVAMVDGTVRLTTSDEACRLAITAALQQAEGRGQPGVVLLPGGAP